MLNLKVVLRALALLIMPLWAQNAAALSCGSAAGSLGGNLAAELFANANEDTCGSTSFAVGPTKDGHVFYANEFGVTVQFVNNGNLFAPASKSLSCTGSTGTSVFSTVIRANFPSTSYSTSCTLTYTDANSMTVTHSFGASTSSSFGFIVGALNGSSVTTGWFERISPTVSLTGLASTISDVPQWVTITFSEPVYGFAPTNLNVANALITGYTVVSTSEYQVQLTRGGTGSVSIDVPAGAAADIAGNLNLVSATLTATVDVAAPTVTLSSTSTYVGLGPFPVIATLSEPVSSFTAANVSVSNVSVHSVTQLTSTSYRILIRATGNGPATVQIGAAVLQDPAGNANVASNTLNLTADSIPPTGSFSGLPATVYTGIPKTISVNFSEPVTGFVLTDITRAGATLSNFTMVDASNYTFVLTPTGATNVFVAIQSRSFVDLAQNRNSFAVSAVRATNAGAATPIAASFSVNPALGTSLPHTAFFTDTTTPTSGETITSWAWDFGDGSTSTEQNPVHSYTVDGYTYSVSLFTCDAGGCSGASGEVTIATPLATLGAWMNGLGGTFDTAQTITLTVSNRVDPSVLGGLTLADFSTTNLTLSNLVSDFGGLDYVDTEIYSFTATPNGEGPASIVLPAGKIANFAGVQNTTTNILTGSSNTLPTMVLSGISGSIQGRQTVTVTASEAITGFALSDLLLTNATVSELVQVSPSVYTFTLRPISAGPVAVTLPANTVIDALGGNNGPSPTLSASATMAVGLAAQFTASPVYSGTVPATVNFSDGSTATTGESITSWAWDFGDGSTATTQNPSHVFTANGVYTVALTVCDPVACNSTSSDITVNASLGEMTATLSGFNGTISGAVSVTVTMSNRVNPAVAGGLTLSDFATTNLTLSNLQQTVTGATELESEVWTLTATPDALGAIELSLPAGAVQNFAASANTVSNILTGNENTAPIADAGGDQVVASGAVVTLDASGSSDPDGTALSYSWSASTGISLSDAAAASPSFTADTLAVGDPDLSYSFTLTVSDGIDSAQDTVQITVRAGVTVTLSGLPAEISGPGSHAVTIDFSRAVTGFTASDISVAGGAVSSLSGSGARYVAVIEASGNGDLAVSVRASVAADANSIGNADSNTLAAVNVLNTVTSKEIAKFMQTRTNALLGNQPRLAGFLRGGGAGQFSADVSRGGGVVAFDSGTNAPIWARLNANWSTDTGAESRYIFGVVGGHSRLSENLLIGGMLQFDHLTEANGPATTQGTGWLLGPYFVAKLPHQPLYFEGSLLYGQTANTVSPLGTFSDDFTTERWLATLGVSGQIERGSLTLIPFLDAKYTTDSQAAYVDGLGNPIAPQTIGLAQASAGLDFELALNAATKLNGGVSGVWSYSSGSVLSPGYADGRARVNLGVAHRFGDCNTMDLMAFYDGIGAADYESFGAEFKWSTCF